MAWVLSSQWTRAYRGWSDHIAYRSHLPSSPLGEIVDWVRSVRAWRGACQRGGHFSLDIDGIAVADLVIDSYLRFRPSPRFDIADRFVLLLIRQAYRDVRHAHAYFSEHMPKVYLTSYSTYIEHGIPVRVALAHGVKVFSFGNFVQIGKPLTLQDSFHTPNCERYRQVFNSLDQQPARLALAEKQLRFRLSGGIDSATSYMLASAYSDHNIVPPHGVRGAVVVFLHDFYDSPHVYADLVFDDFWAWICFTVKALDEAGIPFYLKPHPNQIELSNAVLRELQVAYPRVRFLPVGVTNVQLVDAGMLCGITVYGTVAHELAYLGIPTIACARHPHTAFDFCRTARTKSHYLAFLRSPSEATGSVAVLREQALTFYYMHNLYGEAEHLALRALFVDWWKACQWRDLPQADLTASFDRLRRSAEFVVFVRHLLASGS